MLPKRLPVILLACSAFGQQQRSAQDAGFYTLEKERALGAGLAKDVRRQITPVDSDSVRDYVDRLGSRLSAYLPDTGLTYEITVMFDSAGAMHEPIALPGAYMFVPVALFIASESEAEFAGMLAHTLAHAAERHHTRIARQGQVVNLSSIPLIFAGGWSIHYADRSLVPVGYRTFMRDHELAADRLAVQVMSRAGYDPTGLLSYISRNQKEPAIEFDRKYPVLPPLDARLTNLHDAIERLPARAYPPSAEFHLIKEEVGRMRRPVRHRPTLRRQNER